MKNEQVKYLLIINLAMLCISTSGPLGRYISLPAPLIVWYRAFFALLFLGGYCYWKRYSLRFDIPKYGGIIFASGVLMATHWITYFYALKWSNVAIGMLALFTYPIMTTLLEPLFLKTKLQSVHLFLSAFILVGIYFLVPSFDFRNTETQGLLLGLVSALSYAIRNIILKKHIREFNGSVVLFYQVIITVVLLLPVFMFFENDWQMVQSQLPFLIFLGLITTAIGHTLFLNSFKHFSISTASIISSMQPVFGIVLAIIFLQEFPNWRSIVGGMIILSSVIIESRRSLK